MPYHFRGSRKKVGGGGVCSVFPNRRSDRTVPCGCLDGAGVFTIREVNQISILCGLFSFLRDFLYSDEEFIILGISFDFRRVLG